MQIIWVKKQSSFESRTCRENVSSKWLAEKLGKNEANVSRWCKTKVQPPIKAFVQIAEKLHVKLTTLFNASDGKTNYWYYSF